jgi:sulfur-oxidizing protein SoxA
MKKRLLFALLLALAGAGTAHAGPEEDRRMLIAHYKWTIPGVRFEDYVFGVLALDPALKSQYDDIMAFPPFSFDVDEGRKMWEQPLPDGKHFSSCFANGGRNVAGNYPRYDAAAHRVVTFEDDINACLEKNGGKPLDHGGKPMALLTAYARSLSDNMKVNVKVEGPDALAAYEKGKRFYYALRGPRKISCASCHVDQAGKPVRGQPVSMLIGQATHYPVFIGGTQPMTLQQRFRHCERNLGVVSGKLDSDEFNDLEYFMTYMSNGLPMQTPVYRK